MVGKGGQTGETSIDLRPVGSCWDDFASDSPGRSSIWIHAGRPVGAVCDAAIVTGFGRRWGSPATAAGAAANNRTADSGTAGLATAENIPAPIPSEGEQPASQAAATTATDDSLLDNGLWPGASGAVLPELLQWRWTSARLVHRLWRQVVGRDRPRTSGLSFTYSEIPQSIGSTAELENIPIFTQVFTTHSAGFNVSPATIQRLATTFVGTVAATTILWSSVIGASIPGRPEPPMHRECSPSNR